MLQKSFIVVKNSNFFLSRRSAVVSFNVSHSKYKTLATSIISLQANKNCRNYTNILPTKIVSSHYNAVRLFSSESTPPVVENFETLVELQIKAATLFHDKKYIGTKNGNSFDWITYGDFNKQVENFRKVLKKFSIGYNDKVAIISNNRLEWAVCAYATFGMGGQFVPMYEAQLASDWKYIIEDSNAKLLIVSNEIVYEKTKDFVGTVGSIKSIVCFESTEDKPHSYKKLMHEASQDQSGIVPTFENLTKDDLCVLIYTSGTTGKPKGVMLSHYNITSQFKGLPTEYRKIMPNQTSCSILPWAHVYGMSCELFGFVPVGSAMAVVPNREAALECLGIVKPTVILAVPALFNRIYDGIQKNINSGSPVVKALFNYAMKVARKRNDLLMNGKSVPSFLNFQHKILDGIIFKKIRAKISSNLRYMGAGGAATSLPVLHFFEDIGIPIVEGYGLTETSPIITFSTLEWEKRRLGCVGVALNGVDIQIIDPETLAVLPSDTDGEITCAGHLVMVGYHNNSKATDEVIINKDGKRFFRTGDMGRLVEGKFLKITGRIKEQYKLENGKYVVPAPLEDVYTRSPYIAQMFIYGANKPHNIALIVPNAVELTAWFKANKGKDNYDPKEFYSSPEFVTMINKELIRLSKPLKGYEQPMAWAPLYQPFSQENQMLTPKMSLRRNGILKEYQALVDAIYASNDGHRVDYKKS
eukprot:gene4305-6101_t